jgi:hypothetical protein
VDLGRVLAELNAAALIVLADKGYQGAAHAKVPYKGKNKPPTSATPRNRRVTARSLVSIQATARVSGLG